MKIALILILVSGQAYPQEAVANIISKLYSGISESVGWHDIPVAVYMINENSMFARDNTKLLSLPAFGFDRSFQGGIGHPGKESAGGMDQNRLPGIIMYSRAAYTIAKDVISPGSVTKDDYKRIFLFYKTMVYTHTITEIAKNLVDRPRPDNSDTRSFFSGHTAVTFAAANFLYREIDEYVDSGIDPGNKFKSIGIKAVSIALLFGWAGYVAYSRIYDNKHYISDVLLGAAVGTLISNFVYNSYLNTHDSLINYFSLGMVNNSPSVSFSLTF
jgi:membrane-associated phospholipid phosphatase